MSSYVPTDGIRLFKENRFHEAIVELKNHLAEHPNDVAARVHLGAALGQVGNFSEAAEEFLALTRLDPDNSLHCYNLGKAYEACSKDLLAAGAYEKALHLKPDYQKAEERLRVLNARKKAAEASKSDPLPRSVQNQAPPVSQAAVQYLQGPAPFQPGIGSQPIRKNDTPDYVVVLALLLITPLGVYLMWAKTAWNAGVKAAITALWALGILIFMVNVSEPARPRPQSYTTNPGTYSPTSSDSETYSPSSTDTETPSSSADVSPVSQLVLESWSFTGGEYSSEITGTIRNDSEQTFSYAQVEFNLYDPSGAQVGSTMDNINNLEPHGRWQFKAIVMENSATRARCKGISAW